VNRVLLGCAAVAVNRVKGMEGEAPPLRCGGRGVEWSSLVEEDLRSCGSRCRVLVVGGRRSFDGSSVGRDWVGQRRELEGSIVHSRIDCIFRADENEERGTVRFYGFPGLVSHSHTSTQKSMCSVTQFLCGPRASPCGPGHIGLACSIFRPAPRNLCGLEGRPAGPGSNCHPYLWH